MKSKRCTYKMKIISTFGLLITFLLTVHAQESQSNVALEFSLGFGKTTIANQSDFAVNSDVCTDYCFQSILKDPGYEINGNVLGLIQINRKNHLFFGVGVIRWNYNVDLVNTIVGDIIPDVNENIWLPKVAIGYRHYLKNLNQNSLFFEAQIQSQLALNNKFNVLLLAFEPGLGYKFPITENSSLISVLSYKIGINDISPQLNRDEIHRSNVIGLRISFAKSM